MLVDWGCYFRGADVEQLPKFCEQGQAEARTPKLDPPAGMKKSNDIIICVRAGPSGGPLGVAPLVVARPLTRTSGPSHALSSYRTGACEGTASSSLARPTMQCSVRAQGSRLTDNDVV